MKYDQNFMFSLAFFKVYRVFESPSGPSRNLILIFIDVANTHFHFLSMPFFWKLKKFLKLSKTKVIVVDSSS